MDKAILWLFALSVILSFNGCTPENKLADTNDLVACFNSRGRWERFQNATLMYGEKITKEAGELLLFDTSEIDKIYRKAAHVFEADSNIVYYMYGVASSDSILSEWRVRSFRNNEMVSDALLLKFFEDDRHYHDYWFDGNQMTLSTRKVGGLRYHTYFHFEHGEVINDTTIIVPVFKSKVLWPDLGRKVLLSNRNHNNEEQDYKAEIILKGTSSKFFGGGKSCPRYMIVELDTPYKGFQFIQTNSYINQYTSIYGLVNDSLELRMIECFEPSYWPVQEPVFLERDIYLEYQ
ncbi:MAG: hypothetical protein AAFP77_18550 [Bacteroidota bacterium]